MADKIAGLLFKISADTKALRQGFKQTQKSVGIMQKQFSALGPIIAGAFSVQKVAAFTKEIIKLAGRTEGVREAFDALDKPDLLKDLRKATRGTVSDLELMSKTVQARNFKIPLDELATYFEFATKRAAQTGESVDYLVNSIITGIGRKSVLVMDNLGISAAQLQQEVKKIGDFGKASGKIIREELASMGDVAVTTNQQTEALAATWENIKTQIGLLATETLSLSENLGKVNTELTKATSPDNFTNTVNSIKTAVMGASGPLSRYVMLLSFAAEGGGKLKGLLGKTNFFSNMEALFGVDWYPKAKGTGPTPGPGKPEPVKVVQARTKLTGISGIKGPGPMSSADAMKTVTGVAPGGVEAWAASIDRISESIKKLKTVHQDVGPRIIAIQKNITESSINFSSVIAGGIMDVADSLGRGFDNILQVMGNFARQMGGLLIAYGVGMDAFKKAIKNPYAAIAAGIALVAIGSAISNLAARGPGVTSGGKGFSGPVKQMPVQIEGRLRGHDIYWSNKNYSNSLGT